MKFVLCLLAILIFAPASYAFDQIVADLETAPTLYSGDSADDSAIMVNKINPAGSLIFATDKNGGLLVYRMDGSLKHFFKIGGLNNVDIIQNHKIGDEVIDLIAVSNKKTHSLELYTYDSVSENLDLYAQVSAPKGSKVYGLCIGHYAGELQAFMSVKNKGFYQYQLDGKNKTLHLNRSIELESTAEGCVVDSELQRVIIAEEEKGIWIYSLDPTILTGELLHQVNDEYLVSDLEGVDMIDLGNGQGYYVVSSQGNDSFAVFGRQNIDYLKSFRIRGDSQIDFVTGTDGISISTQNLGPNFPHGAFIAQDNENTNNEGGLDNQNFKLVRLEKIIDWLDSAL